MVAKTKELKKSPSMGQKRRRIITSVFLERAVSRERLGLGLGLGLGFLFLFSAEERYVMGMPRENRFRQFWEQSPV